MATGFERDVERRVFRSLARSFQSDDFRVRTAESIMSSQTEETIALRDRGADQRIRLDSASAFFGFDEDATHPKFIEIRPRIMFWRGLDRQIESPSHERIARSGRPPTLFWLERLDQEPRCFSLGSSR